MAPPPALIRPSSLWAHAQCSLYGRGDIDPFFQPPPEAVSPAAERGTRMHEAVETDTEPEGEEDLAAYRWATEEVARRLAKHAIVDEWREQRVYTNVPEIHGTPDVIVLTRNPETALIIDYKFGQNAYEDHWHWQMAAYAIGAARALQLDSATALVIMPEMETTFIYPFWARDLEDWKARLQTVRTAWYHPSPPIACEACQFCPARTNCSVAIGALYDLVEKRHPIDLAADSPEKAGAVRRWLTLAIATAEDLLKQQDAALLWTCVVPDGYQRITQSRLQARDLPAIVRDCLETDPELAATFLTIPFAKAKAAFPQLLAKWSKAGWTGISPITFLRRRSAPRAKGKTK